MYTREITGALIGTFILAIILFASSFTFKLVLFGIFIIALIELCLLIRRPYWPSLLVIFFIITSLFLLETYEANRLLFLYSILISVLNDSGAYYLGKKVWFKKSFS
jgi:CDP-diglyceride synthetase